MKAEVQKKYIIKIEIEAEDVEELISVIDYFDRIRPDRALENYYTLFEFQQMLIAKREEITKEEAGL